MRALRGRAYCVPWVVLPLVLLLVSGLCGAPLPQAELAVRFAAWRQGHPIMGATAARPTLAWRRFPEDDKAPYAVFVANFDPAGYVVLNSDDRLPLVVAFSDNSSANLDDTPDNAFRALLQTHVAHAAAALDEMPEGDPDISWQRHGIMPLSTTYGPYLETTWDQCNPYNLCAPETSAAPNGYNGRAPAGCVPVAYAQVLYFHNWPPRGEGSHAYTDTGGSLTGAHNADFSTTFDWEAMKLSYDWRRASQPGDTAVADLIYRLGVACEIDFEAGGSSASIVTLGWQTGKHLFYEMPAYQSTQAELLPLLNSDLQAGYPAVVAIPGHAIVADGLLEDGASISYHINYGWGGDNNGWYAAGSVPGGAIAYGCTGIRPALMAIPESAARNALLNTPLTLNWSLPKSRAAEAARLLLQRLEPRGGAWSHAAETLDNAETGGWEVRSGGRSGSKCWYAGPNNDAVITLDDRFTPAANTVFSFYTKCQLANNLFTVGVSTNDGQSYDTIYQRTGVYDNNLQSATVSLAAYAGKEIMVRLELHSGSSYYPGGGVWVDDLALSSGTWRRWETLALFSSADAPLSATVVTNVQAAGMHTLAAVLEDGGAVRHRRSPTVTLTVNPLFTYIAGPGNTASITGYFGTNSVLEIPSVWDGRTVVDIGYAAFASPVLTHVILPPTLATITGHVFSASDSLQGVFFTGNAPVVMAPMFAPGVVPPLFRLPGTSGWGATLGGYPVLLWNPSVIAGPTFGFSGGRFGFTIDGTPAIPVRVQSAASLHAAQWQNVTNITLGIDGTRYIRDPSVPGTASRFYRFVWP